MPVHVSVGCEARSSEILVGFVRKACSRRPRNLLAGHSAITRLGRNPSCIHGWLSIASSEGQKLLFFHCLVGPLRLTQNSTVCMLLL